MTNKTILAVTITAALVVGSISASSAFADPENGQPFQGLWDAIAALDIRITALEENGGPSTPEISLVTLQVIAEPGEIIQGDFFCDAGSVLLQESLKTSTLPVTLPQNIFNVGFTATIPDPGPPFEIQVPIDGIVYGLDNQIIPFSEPIVGNIEVMCFKGTP